MAVTATMAHQQSARVEVRESHDDRALLQQGLQCCVITLMDGVKGSASCGTNDSKKN